MVIYYSQIRTISIQSFEMSICLSFAVFLFDEWCKNTIFRQLGELYMFPEWNPFREFPLNRKKKIRHDFVVDHLPGIELSYLLQNWQAIWNQTILCLWHTLNGENEKNMKVSCGRHNYKGEFFQANQTDMAAMWWYAIEEVEGLNEEKFQRLSWSYTSCENHTVTKSITSKYIKRKNVNFISFSTLPSADMWQTKKSQIGKNAFVKLSKWPNALFDYMLISLILYAFTFSIQFVRLSYIFFLSLKCRYLRKFQTFKVSEPNLNLVLFDSQKCWKIFQFPTNPWVFLIMTCDCNT